MLVPKYSRSREMDSFRGNSCDYGREGTGEKFRVLHYLDSSGKKEMAFSMILFFSKTCCCYFSAAVALVLLGSCRDVTSSAGKGSEKGTARQGLLPWLQSIQMEFHLLW